MRRSRTARAGLPGGLVCSSMLILATLLGCETSKRPSATAPSAPGALDPSDQRAAYVKIPAGRFVMGSPHEEQLHVELRRDFLIKTTEVTQQEWEAVMGHNPSAFQECASCPVESVSWYDALQYLNKLSQAQGLEPCYALDGDHVSWPKGLDCLGYRLPTEAEWEYAARAGATSAAPGEPLDQVAWCKAQHLARPHSVAQKAPNAWGLYDMLGNVWEWTWGWPDGLSAGVDPISATSSIQARVVRGASWHVEAESCHAAERRWPPPKSSWDDVGLRPVRTVSSAPSKPGGEGSRAQPGLD